MTEPFPAAAWRVSLYREDHEPMVAVAIVHDHPGVDSPLVSLLSIDAAFGLLEAMSNLLMAAHETDGRPALDVSRFPILDQLQLFRSPEHDAGDRLGYVIVMRPAGTVSSIGIVLRIDPKQLAQNVEAGQQGLDDDRSPLVLGAVLAAAVGERLSDLLDWLPFLA